MNESEHILYNIQAEREVIGGMLVDDTGRATMLLKESNVTTEWFYDPYNRIMMGLILDLIRHHHPVSLAAMLELTNRANSVFPLANSDVNAYIDDFTTISHYEWNLEVLRTNYQRRRLLAVLELAPGQVASEKNPMELAAELKHSIDECFDDNDIETRTTDDIRNEIRMLHDRAQKVGAVGVPSRYSQVQKVTSGYPLSKMTLVAARPSIGKTTFCCNESRFMVQGAIPINVGWISLDDTEIDLYRTMAGEAAGIDLMKFAQGDFNIEEGKRFDAELERLLEGRTFINDKKMTIDHIVNWIMYMKQKKQLRAVFVDYVQIIQSNDYMAKWSQLQKVTHWSHELHRVAKTAGIALIVMSQLNRSSEIPPGTRTEDRWKFVPRLSSLKEAGSLEEDAHLVKLLYNDPTLVDAEKMNVVPIVIDIAKNKKGPKERVTLTYRKDKQRIEQRAS